MISEDEFKNLVSGDLVEIFVSKDLSSISEDESDHQIKAKILCNYYTSGRRCLIGIDKNQEKYKGSSGEFYVPEDVLNHLIENKILPSDYKSTIIFDLVTKYSINQKLIAETKVDGMWCVDPMCREFTAFAVSNLPNNKFVCFRCKSSEPWKY